MVLLLLTLLASASAGRWFEGEGDLEYIDALDTAYRMYTSDPEFQVRSLNAPQHIGVHIDHHVVCTDATHLCLAVGSNAVLWCR
jgi:hypothetical protein